MICSIIGTLAWLISTAVICPNKEKYSFSIFIAFVGLAGLCHGGVLVNAPVEINRWWPKKKRGVVNAIVWSGSSVGGIWISPVGKRLIAYFDAKNSSDLVAKANDTLAANPESGSFEEQQEPATGWIQAMYYFSIVQGVIMLATCLLLRNPKRQFDDLEDERAIKISPAASSTSSPAKMESADTEEEEENLNPASSSSVSSMEDRITLKNLNKYRLYKVYILTQIFYGLWRSGTSIYLVLYAEEKKPDLVENNMIGYILTAWAVCEFITRPVVGHLSNTRNRFAMISFLFAIQCLLTLLIPQVDSSLGFMALVCLIGSVQGGAGGLFMTAAIDAVGVELARYAYSVENAVDVIVSGGVVHMYGRMVDKSDPLVIKNPEDKIFYYASFFIFVASIVSFIGSKMKNFEMILKEEKLEELNQKFHSVVSNSDLVRQQKSEEKICPFLHEEVRIEKKIINSDSIQDLHRDDLEEAAEKSQFIHHQTQKLVEGTRGDLGSGDFYQRAEFSEYDNLER